MLRRQCSNFYGLAVHQGHSSARRADRWTAPRPPACPPARAPNRTCTPPPHLQRVHATRVQLAPKGQEGRLAEVLVAAGVDPHEERVGRGGAVIQQLRRRRVGVKDHLCVPAARLQRSRDGQRVAAVAWRGGGGGGASGRGSLGEVPAASEAHSAWPVSKANAPLHSAAVCFPGSSLCEKKRSAHRNPPSGPLSAPPATSKMTTAQGQGRTSLVRGRRAGPAFSAQRSSCMPAHTVSQHAPFGRAAPPAATRHAAGPASFSSDACRAGALSS